MKDNLRSTLSFQHLQYQRRESLLSSLETMLVMRFRNIRPFWKVFHQYAAYGPNVRETLSQKCLKEVVRVFGYRVRTRVTQAYDENESSKYVEFMREFTSFFRSVYVYWRYLTVKNIRIVIRVNFVSICAIFKTSRKENSQFSHTVYEH